MSTNALIEIEGLKIAKVYKHWDGDKEATLPWLKAFNADFAKERGDDPEYKLAQLLRSSVRAEKEFNLDASKHTGWGVVPYHQTMEYNYLLKADGTVAVTRG